MTLRWQQSSHPGRVMAWVYIDDGDNAKPSGMLTFTLAEAEEFRQHIHIDHEEGWPGL